MLFSVSAFFNLSGYNIQKWRWVLEYCLIWKKKVWFSLLFFYHGVDGRGGWSQQKIWAVPDVNRVPAKSSTQVEFFQD